MRAAFLLLIVFAACGRVAFDPTIDADTTGGDGASTDTALLTYPDVVLADLPSAYWRMGDLGASTTDETGRYSGVLQGTCRLETGALTGDSDRAMTFDGVSCLVSFGDVSDFTGNAAFAIELWFNRSPGDLYQVLFMNETRTGPDPLDGYAVVIGPPGLYLERIVGSVGSVTPPQPVTPNVFVHVVATYDGGAVTMFMDGVKVGAAVPATEVMPVVSADATLGAIFDGFSHFKGTLDEVAIYDHALSAARIALHYDVGINGPR